MRFERLPQITKYFGELAVNASSIKGILVIESTVVPPTIKTTAKSSVYDGMT